MDAEQREPWEGILFYLLIRMIYLSAEEVSGVWIA